MIKCNSWQEDLHESMRTVFREALPRVDGTMKGARMIIVSEMLIANILLHNAMLGNYLDELDCVRLARDCSDMIFDKVKEKAGAV
jgi:hypothetical protein